MRAPRLRTLLGALLALLVALFAVRAARHLEAPPRLTRPELLALGAAVYASAYLFRAVRLRLLLPREDRPPFLAAWSLSGATTFLLQVVPFRGGEAATWAAYREALGTSWARATAVFALVKGVDSATSLLAGMAGAALLAWRSGRAGIGGGAAALVVAGSAALLAAPFLASGFLARLTPRLPRGSRRARAVEEIAAGFDVARRAPLRYLGAVACGLAFFGGHLVALRLVLEAFARSVPLDVLAVASVGAILVAGIVPFPAGTFGPMESGFAAGLATAGIPLGEGALLAALVHLVTTLVCGALGLPWMLRTLARR